MSRVSRWISLTLAAVWFAALAPATAAAQSVIRGPYLQMGTDKGVVVRWRTDVATDSRVSYGSAPDSLTSAVDDPASKTEHEVMLSSLQPNTRYYYAIGTTTGTLAGNDASHFFLTAPPPGTPKPTRLWVLGDSGTANSNAAAVRDAYYAFAGTRHTDLWLMLGDNAYSDGTDSQYQAAVFNMYPTMLRKSVLWPTLGNRGRWSWTWSWTWRATAWTPPSWTPRAASATPSPSSKAGRPFPGTILPWPTMTAPRLQRTRRSQSTSLSTTATRT